MSRNRDSDYSDCKVYVGNLGDGTSKQELEEAFSNYGPLRNVWVAKNPPGFAFIEFEDRRDVEDAVKELNGRTICGRRVQVEISSGKSKRRFRGPPNRGRPFHPENRCYECGERGHYARECYRRNRRRSRSPSYNRRTSRSRSRSRGRQSKSASRSPTPSRSRSHSRSASRRGSHSGSRSRSRSRSAGRSNASASPKGNQHGEQD